MNPNGKFLCLMTLLIIWVFSVCTARADLATWDQLLNTATKNLGTEWCGLINGKVQLSAKIMTLFGYQMVSPQQKELVLHLWAPQLMGIDKNFSSYLRIIKKSGNWWIWEGGQKTARKLAPSKSLERGQQFGLAFGLPANLIPTENPTIKISQKADEPHIVIIETSNVNFLFPGLEGKFELKVDRDTGFPKQLIAFGLEEWQGAPSGGFKLLLHFDTFPGCHPRN